MKLEFIYSTEFEIQRVKQTISESEWFKKFNYKLYFPEGFSLDSKDLSNLKHQVEKEMDPAKIREIKQEIVKNWKENSKCINPFLDSISYRLPKSLVVTITQYGVGGSYWLPDEVIINISYSWLDYFETLFHELIHLIIEKPIVQKYKLEHGSKEALIDYIMTHNQYLHKMFPKYKIQKAFSAQLPDEEILNKLNWI
jgi:hypothetical protein